MIYFTPFERHCTRHTELLGGSSSIPSAIWPSDSWENHAKFGRPCSRGWPTPKRPKDSGPGSLRASFLVDKRRDVCLNPPLSHSSYVMVELVSPFLWRLTIVSLSIAIEKFYLCNLNFWNVNRRIKGRNIPGTTVIAWN